MRKNLFASGSTPSQADPNSGSRSLRALAWWFPWLLALCLCAASQAKAQNRGTRQEGASTNPTPTGLTPTNNPGPGNVSRDPQAALQTGIRLTRQGRFIDAIPYLLIAQRNGAQREEFAANFDLSLCYVGSGQYGKAIPILLGLRARYPSQVNVENLLAQAYIGSRQPKKALEALRRAATVDPSDVKLYLFATDACTQSGSHALGLRVADLGLSHLPHSARLHYQRGMFLSQLNRADLATKEFQLASKYGGSHPIAYMGVAQAALLNGNMPAAIKAARQGLQKSPDNYVLLAILGKALVRSGVAPGEPEFTQALQAMAKAVAEQPDHPGSQVTLGNLYLMAGKLDKAIVHLEKARALDPQNTSVYAHLAMAYRRRGNLKKAREMLETLARINQRQAAAYRTGPGTEHSGYVAGGMAKGSADIPHRR